MLLPINQIAFGILLAAEITNAAALSNSMHNLGGALCFAVITSIVKPGIVPGEAHCQKDGEGHSLP